MYDRYIHKYILLIISINIELFSDYNSYDMNTLKPLIDLTIIHLLSV